MEKLILWITPSLTVSRALHPHPLDYLSEKTQMYFRPQEIDVVAVRKRMHMTQKQFCRRFGFTLGTLRHWERGDRRPSGTALTLLTVVRHNPRAVVSALMLQARREGHTANRWRNNQG